MTRTRLGSLAAAASLAAALGCSTYGAGPAGVTSSPSIVAGCQNVGDVAVAENTPPNEVNSALSDAARSKGANYVLVASDGARSGAAYRCEAPKVESTH
jgi:hypothetical protein